MVKEKNIRYFWNRCEVCGKKIRKFRKTKEFNCLCFNCFRKGLTIIKVFPPTKTLEEVLEKVHYVKTYFKNKGTSGPVCLISLPSVMVGKKVKLILVDE